MNSIAQNNPEILCAEILAEARRECEEIAAHAHAEVQRILATASSNADKIEREGLQKSQEEASHRRALVLATISLESERMRSARVERLLDSVRDEIRRRLMIREFDARETIVTLAAEALRQMPGNDFVLTISAADHAAYGGGLAGEITRRVGCSPLNLSICSDATTADGVVVQSADGLQIWDNRLLSRLERFWPELRRQIAVGTSLVSDNFSTGGGA